MSIQRYDTKENWVDGSICDFGPDSHGRYVLHTDHLTDKQAALDAQQAAHAAEVERLQHNNAQLVKTLDIREAALRDLLDAMRSTDPIQAANCRVLEYHQLKEEVANMKADRDNSKSDNEDGIAVWDLDKTMWESIKKSASESNWIPEEYLMNDWVFDVCGWLRDHPEDEIERLTGERDAAVRERDAAVEAMECADKMSDAIHAFCSDCDGECDNCQFCDVAISGDAYRHKRAALSEMEQKA